MALDEAATRAWLDTPSLAAAWAGLEDSDEQDKAWTAHVEAACALALEGGGDLGRRPDALARALAEMAIGGPGPCLLRSMLRVVGLKTDALAGKPGVRIRTAAAAAAWAFRTLYNQPEVTELLQREAGANSGEPFWRVVLRYGVNGCLQAGLDEYGHVLRDHLGLVDGAGDEKVHGPRPSSPRGHGHRPLLGVRT